jgi:predicted nucleic acid-binding protein
LIVALDTNVLVYAEGVDGPARQRAALDAVGRHATETVCIPVQAIGELFDVLVRKARYSHDAALASVQDWVALYRPLATTAAAMEDALELAARHQLQIWDAVILAAAAQARCDVLYSEDMQDGFTWRGTTVRNPFPTPFPPLTP